MGLVEREYSEGRVVGRGVGEGMDWRGRVSVRDWDAG